MRNVGVELDRLALSGSLPLRSLTAIGLRMSSQEGLLRVNFAVFRRTLRVRHVAKTIPAVNEEGKRSWQHMQSLVSSGKKRTDPNAT